MIRLKCISKDTGEKAGHMKSLLLIIGMILIAWRISGKYYQILLIQGNSMTPAYHHMQFTVINKYDRVYTYGDVIAFSSGRLKAVLVKRVAAVPGDTVRITDGTLYVNNEISVAYPEKGIFQYAGIVAKEIRLAKGEYFVLGDNAAKSRDSRYREVGMVDEDAILGRVIR